MSNPKIYIQHADEGPEDGPRPFGLFSWAIVDEYEGGIVAWAGALSRAILIRDAIRASYGYQVGDRIVVRDTPAVLAHGLEGGWRGRITAVHFDGTVDFLTDEEEDDAYPWHARPEHIQHDND